MLKHLCIKSLFSLDTHIALGDWAEVKALPLFAKQQLGEVLPSAMLVYIRNNMSVQVMLDHIN